MHILCLHYQARDSTRAGTEKLMQTAEWYCVEGEMIDCGTEPAVAEA